MGKFNGNKDNINGGDTMPGPEDLMDELIEWEGDDELAEEYPLGDTIDEILESDS